ncbi:MAG: hypothetical protein ACRDS0_16890 [Pseudonocardiaceae bacterium]
MFEAVYEAWVRYSSALVKNVPENDVRLNLDGEVRTRLRQLDLILKKLTDEIKIITPRPEDIERSNEFIRQHHATFVRGEMSIEEWVAGTGLKQKSADELQYEADAWESIGIFTEAFYFFAWRLIEVLNGNGEYRFPNLERMRKSEGVGFVRNHLIQHPENKEKNFTQGLVITNSGPVLRSHGAIIDGATGEVRPSDDTKDQGLYVTAVKLRDEMQRKFESATTAILASRPEVQQHSTATDHPESDSARPDEVI